MWGCRPAGGRPVYDAAINVARDRLVFNLAERTGNIWMTQLPDLP